MTEIVLPTQCENFPLGTEEGAYTDKEVILYALGVGVSLRDPTCPNDLKYSYENSDGFGALPSLAVCLCSIEAMFEGLSKCPGMPAFNPMMLLHGEQHTVLHKPLPTSCRYTTTSRIKSIADKGSGALVVIEAKTVDAADQSPLCDNDVHLFIRGIGGFDAQTKKNKKTNSGNSCRGLDWGYCSFSDYLSLAGGALSAEWR
eukprot:Filipodium_phascolosomae@DN4634_c0_g1_i1.p1